MAERQACADIVASVETEIRKKQDAKVNTDNKNLSVETESDEESGSSEYEEVEEIVEEEVEEEEEEEQVEEEEEEEGGEKKKVIEEECEKNEEVKNIEENKCKETQVVMRSNSSNSKNQEKIIPVKEEPSKTNNQTQGESLLLPLLQGLLHKNTPQARPQALNEINKITVNDSKKGNSLNNIKTNNKEGPGKKVGSGESSENMYSTSHHIEDSGTESGEDLKFIAAGLRNSMQIQSMNDQSDVSIISEVTAALNRLEQSLKEGKDLKLEPSKKDALLSLVGRLQTGLISPEKITAPTPLPGQNSKDNDTSSPEGDTCRTPRQSHQRFAKRRNRANRHTVGVSSEELADARRYIEEMVMIETLSNCTTPESSAVTPPDFSAHLEKNNPSSEGNPKVSTLVRPNQFVPNQLKQTSSNQCTTLGVQMREKKPKHSPLRQSANMDESSPWEMENSSSKRPLSESYDYNTNQSMKEYKEAMEPIENPYTNIHSKRELQSTEEFGRNSTLVSGHGYAHPSDTSVFSGLRPSAYTAENADSNKHSRFSSKKLMMKRANTIDIPKPIKYMNDMESDSEAEERGIKSNKSIGLRGTVQVSVKQKPRQVVPTFQPKTDNDHKFLAFIQKQSPSHGLGWNNPNKNQVSVSNWRNKFGNIVNAFETGAMMTSGKPPVPSSVKNYSKRMEQVQSDRVMKPAWMDRNHSNGGAVLSKTKGYDDRQPEYVPNPTPINKFSHAPMSAFKPVESVPLFQTHFQPIPAAHQYPAESQPVSFRNQTQSSPTKFAFSGRASNSPTSSLPWASKPQLEKRVVSLAAAKLESKSPTYEMPLHEPLRHEDERYQQKLCLRNSSRSDKKGRFVPSSLPYKTDSNSPQMVYGYQTTGSINGDNLHRQQETNFPPLPYTCTDYTQPSCVSTYGAEQVKYRKESLTNPNSEPLVLTSNRPVINPNASMKEQQPLKIFDYPSSPESANQTLNDITDDELDSSIIEYKAESKYMKGPISQEAVIISNRTARVGDDEKFGGNSKAAQKLLSVMKNIGHGNRTDKKQDIIDNKQTPQSCVSPDGSTYQAPVVEPNFPVSTNTTPAHRLPAYTNPKAHSGGQYYSQNYVSRSQPATPPLATAGIPYQTQTSLPYVRGSPTPHTLSHIPANQKHPPAPYSPSQTLNNPMQTHPYQKRLDNFNPQQPMTHEHSAPYQKQSPIPYSPGGNQQQSMPPQVQYYPNVAPKPSNIPETHVKYSNIAKDQSVWYQQQRAQEMVYNKKQGNGNQERSAVVRQSSLKYTNSQHQSSVPEPQPIQRSMSQDFGNIAQQRSKQKSAIFIKEEQKMLKASDDVIKSRQPYLFAEEHSKKVKEVSQKVSVDVKKSVKSTEHKVTQESEQVQRKSSLQAVSQKQIQAKASYTTSTVQKSTESTETEIYKSSQPADTPDVVKSSLSKDDFPILKKFGPSRPHLYQPNAYQYPLGKSESSSQIQPRTFDSSSRKFSEPSVVTKFTAPQIVETPSTPVTTDKDEIPANIVCRNIVQFSQMARRSIDSQIETTSTSRFGAIQSAFNANKPEMLEQQKTMKRSSPSGFPPSEGNQLRRVKSGHSLAVPKMYEAGFNKSEVIEKQKTVAAYFSGQKSPNSLSRNSSQTNITEMAEINKSVSTSVSTKRSTINRMKTSEKTSTSNAPTMGLSRSQTMPHIGNLNLLDESNVEDAFEELLNSSQM